MNTLIQSVAFCAMIMMSISPVFAVIIDVPGVYGSIQAGLDASANGDTVLVQPGIYVENIIWPYVNGIKLVAVGDSSNTMIDGNQAGRVITMVSGGSINSTTVIRGFTIRNGLAEGDWPEGSGGGIFCYQSSPRIRACRVVENSAISDIAYGGGVYCAYQI